LSAHYGEELMNKDAANAGFTLRAGEGEARWWLGSLAVIKATGEDTGGAYSLVEVTEPAGADGPLHVHHREDEGFWILQGELTFRIGDATMKAGPGSFVFGPKGVPHTYRVDAGPARILYILSPAGFEGFIRASSQPADSLTLPPESSADDAALASLVALAERYGAEILG
jgi:mannose-6-phosphate isomerase-like protein (cupin superfamily)